VLDRGGTQEALLGRSSVGALHTPNGCRATQQLGAKSSKLPLLNFLRLADQFVWRESCSLSADRAAVVISDVLRQSTSLTSTPPLRPCASWNINKSPSL